jgi:hypothetical protein
MWFWRLCLLTLISLNVCYGTVRLRTESFDIGTNVAEELHLRRYHVNARAASMSDTESVIWIAHMNPTLGTPWSEQMIKDATGHQGRLLHVPEHSFLFYGTPKEAFKMEALGIVDWVGKMHPRHRKSPIAYPEGYGPENCVAEPEIDSGGQVKVHEIVIMMFPITPERTKTQARILFDQWLQDLTEAESQVENVDYEFKFWTHDRFTLRTKSSCTSTRIVASFNVGYRFSCKCD